jgi:DNA (cytosine-5)-methyltransferase 1
MEFAVVDLFAGPGGLAEGFSRVQTEDGRRPFQVVLSVEQESAAFDTLRLRSFLRQFPSGLPAEYYRFLNGEIDEPDWSVMYHEQWTRACQETLRLELGSQEDVSQLEARLSAIAKHYQRNIILIGGPPCQAYSLVGRARNKGIKDYSASKDHRHFLYKEYVRILRRLMPAIFVMENVKGMLSSSVDGERVFDRVLDDLSEVGNGAYRLVPICPRSETTMSLGLAHPSASDFVVRSEDHGIPQARHRVIIVGVRSDISVFLSNEIMNSGLLAPLEHTVTVRDVIAPMPRLRSGISGGKDSDENWRSEVSRLMREISNTDTKLPRDKAAVFRKFGRKIALGVAIAQKLRRRTGGPYGGVGRQCSNDLKSWLVDTRLTRFPNNETRSHMLSDLGRYFFASLYGRVAKVSPKASVFPRELSPRHRNWRSGKFADRFRAQLWNGPATTVTSHISKDGHYFIHPDPSQCRSLTVREAARLQTFPDNYFFKGNRTEQFVQVGNAVPPFLAYRVAVVLHELLLMTQAKSKFRGSPKVSCIVRNSHAH